MLRTWRLAGCWLLAVPILAPTPRHPLRQTADIAALPELNWNAPRVL